MGQIIMAILPGAHSREVGHQWLWNHWQSDEVTEGRSSVRAEEERVERGGWIAKS